MKGLRVVGIVCILLGVLLVLFLALLGKIFIWMKPEQAAHGITLGRYWTSPLARFEMLVAGVLITFGTGFVWRARREE